MRVDDWIIDFLVNNGVTDIFGIPGAVILDFLYAANRRKPEIVPHLTFHEQGAAFAACGYAQISGKLGVAYATRGPGFTNMITAIADAYYDSIPTMFITSHATKNLYADIRVMNNQEIDTISLVKNITKKATRIDDIDNFQEEFIELYKVAMEDRKGPVVLDIWSGLFSLDIEYKSITKVEKANHCAIIDDIAKEIENKISVSKRPVILIGNGIRNKRSVELLEKITRQYSIPVLSSRIGQDIMPHSEMYFGFIGSRATRYSNFILSKADLIIAFGNRMAFPINSKSFWPIIENTNIIRIDVDRNEFVRELPGSSYYAINVDALLPVLAECELHYSNANEWINICRLLKERLKQWDTNEVIEQVKTIIERTTDDMPLVCDVGNHSFWISTAYAYQQGRNRILYSGSFGTLGSALPKAIGAYYSNRKPVICFCGDQGIQFNIQELQYIGNNQIPLKVVVLNNQSSGMIMERERAKYDNCLVHTTTEDGYSFPDFCGIANVYGLEYCRVETVEHIFDLEMSDKPQLIEILIDSNTELYPFLPIDKKCQDLFPEIPKDLYNLLENM